MEENIIKSFAPHVCPHCSKDLLVEIKTVAPEITTILREEDVQSAKKAVIDKIDADESISIEQKQEALNWIKNPDIIFGPDDVEEIIKGIVK